MTNPLHHYGVIQSLSTANEAADLAIAEGLLGFYPAACVVLARENMRLQAEIIKRDNHINELHAEIKKLRFVFV